MLFEKMLRPLFTNAALDARHDGAILEAAGARFAFSTDSYVVRPLEFPGGDIGKLAVHGTINDLAMCGAMPLALSVGLILEEGFPMEALWRVAQSLQQAAAEAGVPIATGDTKVVERGKGDGVYINTSGVGLIPAGVVIDPQRAAVGDHVLLSGYIADHGIAVMSVREGLDFETTICSDTAALHTLVQAMLAAGGDAVHVLRDPTRVVALPAHSTRLPNRRGLASSCRSRRFPCATKYVARARFWASTRSMWPTRESAWRLYAAEKAAGVLDAMRAHPLGKEAVDIGAVVR